MSKIKYASTVILSRGKDEDPEVYLTLRAPELSFFGGYWVFPGGNLDRELDDRHGSDPLELVLTRCAVREVLEEIDVLSSTLGGTYSKAEKRTARDMVDYAISLESAGDLIARRFTTLAAELHQMGARFSPEGWKELIALHEQITANMKLAGNVLISDDVESARLLSLEKDELKRAERSSRKRHLKRLQKGAAESLETSDIHLETLMAFREFNSHISAVAFPILYQNGQLLETRLIDTLPHAEHG